MTEHVWDFNNDDNFFLGLGGTPKGKWVSIAPMQVELIPDNTVLDLVPQFELDTIYEYYLSPPDAYYGQQAIIDLPGFR